MCSPKQKRSGVYYKFSWGDDELSASDDDNVNVSYRDRVDRILQETELGDQPASLNKSNEQLDLDFSLENCADVTSLDSHGIRPNLLDFTDAHASISSGSEDNYSTETPVILESPLDHPDSGYIEFLTSPSSSGSPDHKSIQSDGIFDDVAADDDSVDSYEYKNRNNYCGSQESSKKADTKINLAIPTAVRFRKFNFEPLNEDSYIDDDFNSYPDPGATSCDELEKHTGNGSTESEAGFCLPMNDDCDVIHDVDQEQPEADVTDTNPIILPDHTLLMTQACQRKRKLKIGLITVVSVVCGLGVIAAMIYLVYRFHG